MSPDIPNWLKNSSLIVNKREAETAVLEQSRKKEENIQEQIMEQERQKNVNRLEQDGIQAIETWKNLGIDEIVIGVTVLFEKAKIGTFEVDRSPILEFKDSSHWSTFGYSLCVPEHGEERPLRNCIDSESRRVNLNETKFDNITQKIYRVWETVEGQRGEGEHEYGYVPPRTRRIHHLLKYFL
jgi:hypothetical protein